MQSETVQAPFTPEQVERLNQWQECGWVHPFTCGHCRDTLGTGWPDGPFNDRLLVATVDGWTCPTCDHKQTWAHRMMVETLPVSPFAGLGQDTVDS